MTIISFSITFIQEGKIGVKLLIGRIDEHFLTEMTDDIAIDRITILGNSKIDITLPYYERYKTLSS